MRDAFAVRLHVQHYDALLDRHGRRKPLPLPRYHARAVDVRVREHPVSERGPEVGQRIRVRIGVRVDDRATAAWVLDVLDAYRDLSSDNLSATFRTSRVHAVGESSVRACSMVNGWTTSLP